MGVRRGWVRAGKVFAAILVAICCAGMARVQGTPTAMRAAFFLGQAMILWWIGMRLWQGAADTVWYHGHFARVAVGAPEPPRYPLVEPSLPSPMPPPLPTDQV